jgi:hypothetical protein
MINRFHHLISRTPVPVCALSAQCGQEDARERPSISPNGARILRQLPTCRATMRQKASRLRWQLTFHSTRTPCGFPSAPRVGSALGGGRVPVGRNSPERAVAETRLGVHRPRCQMGCGGHRRGWRGDRLGILSRGDGHRRRPVGVGCRDGLLAHRRFRVTDGCLGTWLPLTPHGRFGAWLRITRRGCLGRWLPSTPCWCFGGLESARGGLSNGWPQGSGGEHRSGHTLQYQDNRGAHHQDKHGATQSEHDFSPRFAH